MRRQQQPNIQHRHPMRRKLRASCGLHFFFGFVALLGSLIFFLIHQKTSIPDVEVFGLPKNLEFKNAASLQSSPSSVMSSTTNVSSPTTTTTTTTTTTNNNNNNNNAASSQSSPSSIKSSTTNASSTTTTTTTTNNNNNNNNASLQSPPSSIRSSVTNASSTTTTNNKNNKSNNAASSQSFPSSIKSSTANASSTTTTTTTTTNNNNKNNNAALLQSSPSSIRSSTTNASSITKNTTTTNNNNDNNGGNTTNNCGIRAIDLSVNQLQEIPYLPGSLKNSEDATAEDFLPVVESNEIELRWRHKALPSSEKEAIRGISFYQIIAETAHEPNSLIWDTGRVSVKDHKSPRSVEWDHNNQNSTKLQPGTIVRWKVLIWDGLHRGPSISDWSKFAVGPQRWTGKWITHPVDMKPLQAPGTMRKLRPDGRLRTRMCMEWHQRMPLPLARVQFQLPRRDEVSSAMLFVSGLGMFSATLNGKRLSSSSIHDPPLTDFTQRVNYRGFDVTRELKLSPVSRVSHTIGISLGSGWWDGRPIKSAGVPPLPDFMPGGSLTTIAELHVVYSDGSSHILIPTGGGDGGTFSWQVGKGFTKNSNLFTGETLDLVSFHKNQDWDTPNGGGDISWVSPMLYVPGISSEEWQTRLDTFANTGQDQEAPALAPIGRLVPLDIPPVLPIDQIPAVETIHLGNGRWLLDFGKGMSGVVRFEKGLPVPILPKDGKFPRGHNLSMITNEGDRYITVIHGDSIEMSTGDINLVLVAGFGHHSGGERGISKPRNVHERGGPCFPREDLLNYQELTQRDVYLVPKTNTTKTGVDADKYFRDVRQPRFSVHGFRYAEVCCTESPPTDAYAIQYRTAFPRWGEFSSSNPVLNGAYEMTRNTLESNMLGIQSDCPHREQTQYGGDLIAVSPSAMHFFDLSAFYGKVIRDWTTSQFENGAYGVTSVFMDLLADRSIAKRGSGETGWASAPPILAARHMQHYGDTREAIRTMKHHVEWLGFLNKYWDEGIKRMYGNYRNVTHLSMLQQIGPNTGLGDWYSLDPPDHWFTHHAFYMASARAVAYLASQLAEAPSRLLGQDHDTSRDSYKNISLGAIKTAGEIERKILSVYKYKPFQFTPKHDVSSNFARTMGLFTRIAKGKNRCAALKNLLETSGGGENRIWPGDEESLFFQHLEKNDFEKMMKDGRIQMKKSGKFWTMFIPRYSLYDGIFGIRYSLKNLSEMGFHSLALTKASGFHFPGYGFMLSFNATTLWETWWRSEDMFSRNHPMLGAVAEWLSSAVAGVGLSPTTTGGEEILFWPRIPDTVESAEIVRHASATQGTKTGDASIAWKMSANATNSTTAIVTIRILVPPGSTAKLRLAPTRRSKKSKQRLSLTPASVLPDIDAAKVSTATQCQQNRRGIQLSGFPFHWEYNREQDQWARVDKAQAIGTPCESFLFQIPEAIEWGETTEQLIVPHQKTKHDDIRLQPGFYQIRMDKWKLKRDVPLKPGYAKSSESLEPFCSDPSTFDWDPKDAEHLI